MTPLFIRNAKLVTPAGVVGGDLLASEGRIVALGAGLEKTHGARTIDATGCYVLPGGVDPHVHMELATPAGPSRDDFESGSMAALAGGTTTMLDFVTPERGQGLLDALRLRKEAAGKSLCDYGLHMSVTRWSDEIPGEMRRCVVEEGIGSFKLYLAYKAAIGLEDAELLSVMDAAARLGALVTLHCEHGDAVSYLPRKLLSEGKTAPRFHAASRPPEVEGEAVGRALLFARLTGCGVYVVHVSTEDALSRIREARCSGEPVAAETCPHYLLLDDAEYDRPGFEGAAYVMSPPLRPASHREALWEALRDGLVDTVGTDHCPFDLRGQKDLGRDDFTRIPNGVGGIEERLKLLYTYGVAEGRLTLPQFADLTATAPARLFGLHPKKGVLAVGSDADLVVWDPEPEGVISASTQRQRCDTSIYEGFRTRGEPRVVILRGRVAFEEGRPVLETGHGEYLYRSTGRAGPQGPGDRLLITDH
ncbi:MAG: dihydropyrimidinase [Deltaproteobacteria bacterium]|nr:dihydropyrimidinase [Deltaproteobacteria bacterium]